MRPTSSRRPAPTSSCCSCTRARRPRRSSSATDPASDFGQIVNGADANIDAIISGHTHLAYNHAIPVAAVDRRGPRRSPPARWSRPASTATTSTSCCSRSTRKPARCVGVSQNILPLTTTVGTVNAPDVPGRTTRPIRRSRDRGGGRRRRGRARRGRTRPDRRARSTGRSWPTAPPRTAAVSRLSATWSPRCSSGRPRHSGVRRRADRLHEPGRSARRTWSATGTTGHPAGRLTYQQAAVVQPFANTLVNMKLTGAQIKSGAGTAVAAGRLGPAVPPARHLRRASPTPTTRPPLQAQRITAMWLDGAADRSGRERIRSRSTRSWPPAATTSARSPPAPTSGTPGRSTYRPWSTTWPPTPRLPSTTPSARWGALPGRCSGASTRPATRWRSTLSSLAFSHRGRHRRTPRCRSSSATFGRHVPGRQHHRDRRSSTSTARRR